jgi:hypothetical protein
MMDAMPPGPDSAPANSPPPHRPPTEGKAVVALLLAVFGLTGTLCGFGLVLGAPAVVLAVLALRDIRRANGSLGGRAVAFSAAALGLLGSALFFVWVAAISLAFFASREMAGLTPIAIDPADPSRLADPAASVAAGTTPGGLALHRGGGPLAAQLTREASAAAAAGESILVETTASDCEACAEVETAMLDPQTRGALEHVRIVGVDVSEFHSELGRLRMDETTAPWFYLLDARGEPRDAISADEWEDNDAAQIAPVLHAFVRGRLRSRRHRWHGGATL